MSTDADATPTDQTVLEDQVVAAAEGRPQIPQAPPGVTPPASSSQEKTLVAPPREVSSGAVIDDRWQAKQCLASGGYGDVWKGIDRHTDRQVAIKILRTDAGNNDPSAIARMRQEAEILKAIKHPNIVAVYGFGESRFGHFLVMEFLDGKAIDQLLSREGPIDGERAIPLVSQLLAALSEAHSKQILHRDLKPENIIVARDANGVETAKLVDFGIAKAQRLLNHGEEGATLVQTRAGGFMGTPRYAAPEQAVGDPCGPNIDLFALGLVVAEWLTGRMRMDGETHGEVMTKLLSTEEIDISDVPYRWREWLSRMVKKNPLERYQNANEALADLQRLVVELHQPADFLDESGGLGAFPGADTGSFVGTDQPLELDYDRVRETERQKPAAMPQFQRQPMTTPITTGRQQHLQVEEEPEGNIFFKVLFFMALALITVAALALIASALLQRFA